MQASGNLFVWGPMKYIHFVFYCMIVCSASIVVSLLCEAIPYDLCTIKVSPLIEELIHSAAHFDLVSQTKYSTHNTQVFFSSFG
mmetsp:Transcript_2254/g.5155  ORF Transcript_2254/g.5155 Transcript_2254/m.5155 type:complete len:84 (-) Transcript_2254:274-525(-)